MWLLPQKALMSRLPLMLLLNWLKATSVSKHVVERTLFGQTQTVAAVTREQYAFLAKIASASQSLAKMTKSCTLR